MEEVLAHLNGDFDIPDEGVNSNVEWLYDEELEPQLVLPAGSIVVPDEEEEINLRTVQIEERRGGKRETEQCKCVFQNLVGVMTGLKLTLLAFQKQRDQVPPNQQMLWLLISFYSL